MHQWKTLGLPSIPSLVLRMQAVRATTALRLRQLWSTWSARLHEKRGEVVSLAAMGAELSAELGRDSLAHALVLAHEFKRCDAHNHDAVRQVFHDMQDDNLPRQSVMYKALLAADYGDQLKKVIATRVWAVLSYIFPVGAVSAAIVERAVTRFCQEARRHSPIYVLHAMRTWCNAWSTSFRTQGGSTDCVWGCAPVTVDSLQHYLSCAPLWESVAAALGRSVPLLLELAWHGTRLRGTGSADRCYSRLPWQSRHTIAATPRHPRRGNKL